MATVRQIARHWDVVLLGLVAVVVGVLWVLAFRYTSASGSVHTAPPHVVVVGDSYTAGSDMGGTGPASWPAVVEAELADSGIDSSFEVAAAGGSGYVAHLAGKPVFEELIESAAGRDTAVIVVFGSRNDVAPGVQVAAAATQAFDAARRVAPDATLLVIGPPWVDDSVPDNVVASRDAVRSAAAGARATFVDPLEEGWFMGTDSQLIGSDGVHPTDAGHAHLAQSILPHLRDILDSAQA